MGSEILDAIQRPTLLVDLQKARRNIEAMKAKADAQQVRLRPHIKTHQSVGIGELFRDAGIEAITVSSVRMAQYFAEAGWRDILIAFPVNWREIRAINDLAEKCNLALLVDNLSSVEFLSQNIRHSLGVWIKVDTGLHRAGICWEEKEDILAMANAIQRVPALEYRGVLTHAGHTYQAVSPVQVRELAAASKQAMLAVKSYLSAHGCTEGLVSIGDTPGCRLTDDFTGVDEIRPGNFVFFDLEQWRLGACEAQEIAVALACPVVSKNVERKELVLYGGAIQFAKETLKVAGTVIYGLMTELQDGTFGDIRMDCKLTKTTQEHGILQVPEVVFSNCNIGDLVLVYPVHSCLMVQAMGEYIDIHNGEHISSMVQQCFNHR